MICVRELMQMKINNLFWTFLFVVLGIVGYILTSNAICLLAFGLLAVASMWVEEDRDNEDDKEVMYYED